MSSAAAEKLVKELARKPSNTVCANCGTRKKFGFSTVCIKFHTFVCNNCKSSHQAISHRCKSLTMSSWTDAEVAELKRKGNDYARRTWLKNAPPVGQGGRPKEGDSVDVFKRFVVEAYERKKYYGEDEGTGGAAPAQATAAAAHRVSARATRPPVRKAAPPPAPAPAPVADLLDFTSMSAPTPQSGAANTGSSGNAFEANFDAFAPTTPSVPSAAPGVQKDPFAAQPTPTSNASSFGFMNTNTTATPTNTPAIPAIKKPVMKNQSATPAKVSNNSSGAFQANFDAFAQSATASTSAKATAAVVQNDPFQPTTTQATPTSNGSSFSFMNNSSAAPPVVPVTKKPIMNNASMSQKSSLISSMNMPSSQQGQQNNMGMGMGMGWNNNSTTNNNAFNGMGNVNSMQTQMMMQQQQMNMMNGMMNGMNLNSNVMGNGMGMGMMGNSNPMMMGNNSNMMMMGNNNPMMMNQQGNMMNGNNAYGNNSKRNSNGSMQSLQMNMSSMNAWSSGAK